MKYAINKEFIPYSLVSPPILSASLAGRMGSMMRPPGWLRKDDEAAVQKVMIPGYENQEIPVFIFTPYGAAEPLPCLVYYHGGGFFFEGAPYHYKLAKQYAIKAFCKVVFVQYRLAPKHPHPIPAEDSYAALRWTFAHAESYGIDASRIAVGGDSAGGALAAAVCQMARDRMTAMPCFQLLVYPVTDRRMDTESNRKFTDTPMWNSRRSALMWPAYLTDPDRPDLAYASPMEAGRFDGLPPAYIETAEFDCLRDEGIAYGRALSNAGVEVEQLNTRGTMHGFDIVEKAPTTKAAIVSRIRYMRKKFDR